MLNQSKYHFRIHRHYNENFGYFTAHWASSANTSLNIASIYRPHAWVQLPTELLFASHNLACKRLNIAYEHTINRALPSLHESSLKANAATNTDIPAPFFCCAANPERHSLPPSSPAKNGPARDRIARRRARRLSNPLLYSTCFIKNRHSHGVLSKLHHSSTSVTTL